MIRSASMREGAVAALVLAVVAGCSGQGGPAGETALERIQRTGVVRVGYANEAPYAFVDSRSGRLTGEAPEILRDVMQEMGIETIEGVLTEFGALIPGLQARRFDIIAAGMYITPARCEQINFSNPTYTIGEAFIVESGNPLELHSYQDLADHPDATIGVVVGAIERRYARETGVPEDRIIVFPDAPSGLAGVESGRVDAFAGTSLTIDDLLSKRQSDAIERAKPFTDPVIDGESVRGYGAFGFRKSDTDLRQAVNDVLVGYIGTEDHLETVRPFGFTEAQLPGDVTAEELCEP